MNTRVTVVEKIMDANDQVAVLIRDKLTAKKILAINLMASPGAGKTTFILRTIQELSSRLRIGVIEGDTAPVTIDADKITAAGMPAVQINTGGECHLDAMMMSRGIDQLPLDNLDLIIVENVGNLICPAAFNLGTHLNVLIASIPEGDDKPYKYPNIYRGLDVLVISKTDLLPYIKFNMDYFKQGVEILNAGLSTFALSAQTGDNFQNWINWLEKEIVLLKQNG
jgi:hydrogenase nickel incorporation protein HypB